MRLFHKSNYIPDFATSLEFSWPGAQNLQRHRQTCVADRKVGEEKKKKLTLGNLLLPRSLSHCSPPHSLQDRRRWRRSIGSRLWLKLTDLTHLLLIRHRAAFSSSQIHQEEGIAGRCFLHAPYRHHLSLVSLTGSSLMTWQWGQIQRENVKECIRWGKKERK